MSNRIDSMDQGLPGKIGEKIGDAGASKKVGGESSAQRRNVARQSNDGDNIELTTKARLLERLEKAMASLPEIDSARVEAVKAQIESGEYQIDAEKIATILLKTDQELDR